MNYILLVEVTLCMNCGPGDHGRMLFYILRLAYLTPLVRGLQYFNVASKTKFNAVGKDPKTLRA